MSRRAGGARRIAAPWLISRALVKVFDAIEAGGGEARVVGGAVRNSLLGLSVSDIDLATTTTPEETIRLAGARGLAAHPTGVDHGTITVVSDGVAFEVTTLRRDVETDGRHAIVAFTTDWNQDAARRDFTINGLFCRRDGVVVDSVGGLDDIDARRVRFIGDAGKRIREDYLRILRFFRFSAAFAEGPLDGDGLAACIALRDGIARLSAERVGAELMKLLQGRRAGEIAAVMQAAGILELAIGRNGFPDRVMRLHEIEMELGDAPDAITRLAALAVERPEEARVLADRLRLSNADATKLSSAVAANDAFGSGALEAAARAALYRYGAETYARAVRVSWARSDAPSSDDAWRRRATLPERWTAPKLPFGGADVLALGLAPGPRVGAILSAFEAWWMQEDFPSNSSLLAARLEAFAKSD
ncbi:MAG: CCA tRNA nucleotidyltransferase [Hyphomicrobium sp.]